MATTRLIPLHMGSNRTFAKALGHCIDYVKNPEKTDKGQLVTSYQCSSRLAEEEFTFMKRLYIQKTGRVRGKDDVIAYHMRQSFLPGEITAEEANRMGRELAMRFTKGKNAFIVCTHIDKAHIHNHIIISAVTLDCNRKFRNFWGSSRAMRRLNDNICIEHGYSIVENPKRRGKSYDKWLGDKAKPSHRERICRAIDEALLQSPVSFDELLDLLRKSGYTVKGNPTNPSLLGGEQKRAIRMDTLGEGYAPEELRAVISGKRKHKPKEQAAPQEKTSRNEGRLLIDIQEKLNQGKGAAYAQWAKKFNLKQMAKTLIFLQEEGITDYDVLSEKAAEASRKFGELSEKIKAAEKRLQEIAVLKTQIINYVKTRETYIAYRKAGYSKKFLEKHESEIILHKAAKKYFDEKGLKKLPSVKSLNTEYAELLKEKKSDYIEYRKVREKMQDLRMAKSNVERILKLDERTKFSEKEKDAHQL